MSAYSVKRSILNEQEIGEPLEQCRDLRADHSIRKSTMEKKESRILPIASREIVTAEACDHRTCYKGYTRAEASPTGASDGCGESLRR